MPASFMTLFPNVLNSLEAMKIPLQTSADLAETVLTVLGTAVGVGPRQVIDIANKMV